MGNLRLPHISAMKSFVALCFVALAVAVPIAEVPEKPADLAVAAPVAAPEVAAPEVAAPAPVAVQETKSTEVAAVAPKDDAMKQVMSLVELLTGGLSADDNKALKDMIALGTNVIAQAEAKAKDIQAKVESTNLLQSDSIMGIKPDGTIDANVATEQIATLFNLFAPNSMSEQDKTMLHTMISTVSSLVAPLVNPNPNAPAPNPLAMLASPEFQTLLGALTGDHAAHEKTDLLAPQTLLSLFDEKQSFDNKALVDLADKFLSAMESH
eukprot:c6169_g2_i1.p1 GENE.c6169_g2_i1~~c6169_g2_i1.p1  ORF type:complete len:267 (+),score=63.21 c6169_g2_i1:1-801(+)